MGPIQVKRTAQIGQLLTVIKGNANSTMPIAKLAAESGYVEATLGTYIAKNMLAPFVVSAGTQSCRIGSADSLVLADLMKAMSQRENRFAFEHVGVSELVSSLLERSRTNAALALELFNRPELRNRIDAFLLLFVTAWEQLLKAEMERASAGSIFSGDRGSSGRPLTVSFSEAIARAFPDRHAPVRRNLEKLKELRDSAAHLLVPEVIGVASRYFQAGLLNYIERFHDLAKEPPFRFEGTGLLTLGLAYVSPSIEALRARHGDNADEIKALVESLESEAKGETDPGFVVSLQYELVLEKRPGVGALKLVNGAVGQSVKVVKVPKDPKKDWPHSTTACAIILSERTGFAWSMGDVASVAAFVGAKKGDNQFHYEFVSGKAHTHTYSDAFVELVIERLVQTPELVKAARTAQRRKAKR